mgnify:CR=1 FL=1
MWEEPATDAKGCAKLFSKLMKERPQSWSDNMLQSIEDLTDGDEQMRFLAWCADPTNACGNKDRVFKTTENLTLIYNIDLLKYI